MPHTPASAVAVAALEVVVLHICKLQPVNVPTSSVAPSITVNVQVPLAFCPLNADNGFAGRWVLPALIGQVSALAAWSSKLRLKLVLLPQRLANNVTVVPKGLVNRKVKSPTNVWVPCNANTFTSVMVPEPDTFKVDVTVATSNMLTGTFVLT